MKTNFTFKNVKPMFLSFILALVSFSTYATSHTVIVTSNKFDPKELTINAGDTVVWKNQQGSHNVDGLQSAYPNNPESFGNNVSSGWTYQFVFTKEGTYDYKCDPHAAFGMVGKVIVNPKADPGPYTLTVNFTGMTPHVGETLWLAVIDKSTMMEIGRVMKTVDATFSTEVPGIEAGKSYNVDFFADHNKNGVYDAPPADHAWRLELNNVSGNSTLDFSHNTNFIDIKWLNDATPASHTVIVTSNKFDPKELTVNAGDTVIWINQQGSHNVNGLQSVFPNNPESFGNNVSSGWTYKFVFTKEGTYDYQCDPHVGYGMVGKVIVNPKPYTLTVNFSGMTPHVGETLWLAVKDQATNMEVARISKTIDVSFPLVVAGLEAGKSYNVDFYADHNKNGVYDAPPADHAWRMQVNNVTGNTSLDFTHNTNFTDIGWKNKLTVHFTGMTPHLSEKFYLYLYETDNGVYQDTILLNSVPSSEFDLVSYKIKSGLSYHIDFYADHAVFGTYNAPPKDHAWRIMLDNVMGDTIVNFVHNTNFTDIFPVTSSPKISDATNQIKLFPNPASQYIELRLPPNYSPVNLLKVYSITGSVVEARQIPENSQQVHFNLNGYKNGIYFMEINSGNRKDVLKFIKR